MDKKLYWSGAVMGLALAFVYFFVMLNLYMVSPIDSVLGHIAAFIGYWPGMLFEKIGLHINVIEPLDFILVYQPMILFPLYGIIIIWLYKKFKLKNA